jgi:hypothetical protein
MANARRTIHFDWRPASLLGWVLLLLTGCGTSHDIACYPVRGQVQQAGKPLAEALVVFYPLDTPPIPFPKPQAHTDAQGRFELTTFESGDGAPVGNYAITVELRAPRQLGEEVVRDGPSVLSARYSQPDKSGLRAQVAEGENELAPLVIEAR